MLHSKSIKKIIKITFYHFKLFRAFYGLLIGAKGATRNRIESETKTSIKIPRKGENGDVEIIGASIENVSSALRRIEIIVRSSRAKQSPTHFIGIPVRNVEIKSNFETFKVSSKSA